MHTYGKWILERDGPDQRLQDIQGTANVTTKRKQPLIIDIQLTFDAKIDIRFKVMFVGEENLTSESTEDSFTGLVFVDFITAAFFMTDIISLNVNTANIRNAYPLIGHTKDKIFIIAGLELRL